MKHFLSHKHSGQTIDTMSSAGFTWGLKTGDLSVDTAGGTGGGGHHNPINIHNSSGLNPTTMDINKHINGYKIGVGGKKRRFEEDTEGKVHKQNNVPRKMNVVPVSKIKKTKTEKIYAQKLPLKRLIEVLDHKSLQGLLVQLVAEHPEITKTVYQASPRPSLPDYVKIVEQKYNDIINHLPYKCDIESDYSYLRIKPYLNEFLDCLSDFILNFLPPVETNLNTTIRFLDEITNILHKLPNFTNREFQYTKLIAYEQVANTWLIALSHNSQIDDSVSASITDASSSSPSPVSQHNLEKSMALIKLIEELGLKEKLLKHNEITLGKFSTVIDFVDSEMENYDNINYSLNNNYSNTINDLITVDYSNFSIIAKTSH